MKRKSSKKKSRAKKDPYRLLLEKARRDPKFFHALVFSPRKALSKISFLDSKTKDLILKMQGGLQLGFTLPRAECDNTCGGATCGGDTCSGNTCGQTCDDSCDGGTCAPSCEQTCSPSCDGDTFVG